MTRAIGAPGVTGPTGVNETGIENFAYIFNPSEQLVVVGDGINIDTNGVISAGLCHTPTTSTTRSINPSIYQTTFSVTGIEPNQFTLTLNGITIPNSIYGARAGAQQNNNQVILALKMDDVLTLRNHQSAEEILLRSNGGSASNVNASLIFLRIADN